MTSTTTLPRRKVISPSHNWPSSFYPQYASSGKIVNHQPSDVVCLHDETSISRMRNARRLARRLLDRITNHDVARPGRTMLEIDDMLHDHALEENAYPSPLNYSGFPKSLCMSVNEVVCHGIPDMRQLMAGDVVSFDVSVYLDGVHRDNCSTIVVGDFENMEMKEESEFSVY